MPTNYSTEDISDSAFTELQAGKLPGFLFVDHIAIAVCAGELEAQLENVPADGLQRTAP